MARRIPARLPALRPRPDGSGAGPAWSRTRDRLRELVTASAADTPGHEPEEDTESQYALRVLELGMELADILLSTGASANDTAVTVRRVARAYGMHDVHCDVTFTSINVSWHRHHREPLTLLRVVHTRTIDYTRLQRAHDLAHGITTGRLDLDAAEDRLGRIRTGRRPYRRWVIVASSGVLAAGVCALYGASFVVTLLSFLSSCLVHLALGWLARRNLPTFFCQAFGAVIPTSLALLIAWLQSRGVWIFQEIRPSLIVAAGIVLLLAGMSTVGAAQDSIDGYYVTASARSFEVVMLTLGIVAGLLVALRIGKTLGISVLLGTTQPGFGTYTQQLIGAALIAASWAVSCHAGPRTVVLSSAMGVVAWLVYLLMTAARFGPVGASTAGAFVAAVIATLIGERLRVPALALVTAGLVPLLPGGAVYRGVLMMTESQTAADAVSGLIGLIGAAGVGVGLAAGSSLGTFMARPIPDRPRRTRRR